MNGKWRIAESVSSDDIPAVFGHAVVVPGLVNQAKPAFPQVDLFASRSYFQRFARKDRAYLLNATAHPEGTRHKGATVSRRKIEVRPAGDIPAVPSNREADGNRPPARTKSLGYSNSTRKYIPEIPFHG